MAPVPVKPKLFDVCSGGIEVALRLGAVGRHRLRSVRSSSWSSWWRRRSWWSHSVPAAGGAAGGAGRPACERERAPDVGPAEGAARRRRRSSSWSWSSAVATRPRAGRRRRRGAEPATGRLGVRSPAPACRSPRGVLPAVATSSAIRASDTARITHQLGRPRATRERTPSVVSDPPPTTGTPYARVTPAAPGGQAHRRRWPAVPAGVEGAAIASGQGGQLGHGVARGRGGRRGPGPPRAACRRGAGR